MLRKSGILSEIEFLKVVVISSVYKKQKGRVLILLSLKIFAPVFLIPLSSYHLLVLKVDSS
jgi:hypothetical protein